MIFRMRCLIVTDDTLSPYELLIPLWKKYFISNTPCGVCMYLLFTTRLTVDSCMPMSLATSRSTSGREMLDAVVEELALEIDDARGDLLDRLLPLIDRLDQPQRRAELVLHVGPRLLACSPPPLSSSRR